jgi:hypothetical protein
MTLTAQIPITTAPVGSEDAGQVDEGVLHLEYHTEDQELWFTAGSLDCRVDAEELAEALCRMCGWGYKETVKEQAP